MGEKPAREVRGADSPLRPLDDRARGTNSPALQRDLHHLWGARHALAACRPNHTAPNRALLRGVRRDRVILCAVTCPQLSTRLRRSAERPALNQPQFAAASAAASMGDAASPESVVALASSSSGAAASRGSNAPTAASIVIAAASTGLAMAASRTPVAASASSLEASAGRAD